MFLPKRSCRSTDRSHEVPATFALSQVVLGVARWLVVASLACSSAVDAGSTEVLDLGEDEDPVDPSGPDMPDGYCPQVAYLTPPAAARGVVLDSAGDPVLAESVSLLPAGGGEEIECEVDFGSYTCRGDAGAYEIELVRGGVSHTGEVRVLDDDCGVVATEFDFNVGETPLTVDGACPTDRLPLLATVDLRAQDMVDSVFSLELELPEGAVVVTRELERTERDGWIQASIHATSEFDPSAPLTATLFADLREPWCVEGPAALGLGDLKKEFSPVVASDPCLYEPVALVFEEAEVDNCIGGSPRL